MSGNHLACSCVFTVQIEEDITPVDGVMFKLESLHFHTAVKGNFWFRTCDFRPEAFGIGVARWVESTRLECFVSNHILGTVGVDFMAQLPTGISSKEPV